MPINISSDLPAYLTLMGENVFVISEKRAQNQDIRPLRIAIMNLMPTKIETETQLLRLLSNTSLQVDITLLYPESHVSKNTSEEHLLQFYTTFDKVRDDYFDALVITGAPVETLPFESVNYWKELCGVMDWSKTHVHSTLHICWAAQAALYYHYGVPKYNLQKKMFGVFEHKLTAPANLLLKGFDDRFCMPHSRHTEIRTEDIEKIPELQVLAFSDEAGPSLIADRSGRQFFLTGHIEYDRDTLHREYTRDRERRLLISPPKHYYEYDDPARQPINRWSGHASLLYANWLNFCVYQTTPFDITKITPLE